jgi:F-type H+-transporting ATPase subunit c
MSAIGRNPEATGNIQTNMILGIAFAEALGIYALVATIMIGFIF